MGRIITLTGRSRSGKTSVARELLRRKANAHMVTSYTTRAPRTTDLPGEYTYVTSGDLRTFPDMLWTVERGTTQYGTTKISVDRVLSSMNGIGIMILVPEKAAELREYVFSCCGAGAHAVLSHFFLLSPAEDLLRLRMEKEGDTPEQIAERFALERGWEDVARQSSVPYSFIGAHELDAVTKRVFDIFDHHERPSLV